MRSRLSLRIGSLSLKRETQAHWRLCPAITSTVRGLCRQTGPTWVKGLVIFGSGAQSVGFTLEMDCSRCVWQYRSDVIPEAKPNIMRTFLIIAAMAFLTVTSQAADLLDKLGINKSAATNVLSSLPQDQVIAGLKEALAKGVQYAVTNLGKADGFLKDASVHVPMPDSLLKVEKGLRAAGQAQLADQFVTTMNRAAEQAVPEAASVLADSVRQMSIADAKLILASTNSAATDYFRRTSETNLYTHFLPIVKKATEQTGVTSAYKQMTAKVNVGFGNLGGFGNTTLGKSVLNKDALDIDAYVTHKAMEGLFTKIADEEKKIRENPAARTTELLQNVFGAMKK